MSWTDKTSIETFKKLRDEFGVKLLVETGTFKGINAKVQSSNFDCVFTCESNKEYFDIANEKLKNDINVYSFLVDSSVFLSDLVKWYIEKQKKEPCIIYLDAHFYSPDRPAGKGKFVVLDELKALKGFDNCIIVIHDFFNRQFTGIEYDGIKLDIDLLREDLLKVNSNFVFYTNTKCDVYSKDNIKELLDDKDALENIEYAWSKPGKRDRGILYALPKEIDVTKYDLEEIK